MRLVAPPPRPGARAARVARSASTSAGRTPRSGRSRITSLRLRDEGARAGRVVDRDVGAGEREEELDGPGRGRGSQEWSQARRASELATRPGDVPAVDHQPDADGARRDAREVPVDLRCRGDRVALLDEGSGGIPGAPFGGHERAVPEHAVPDRDVARRSGSDDRVGQGRVGAGPIADREARDGQLPEREVPPRAVVPLELDRSGGVRQRVVRAPADHAGSEHRPPGLE